MKERKRKDGQIKGYIDECMKERTKKQKKKPTQKNERSEV